MTDIKKLIKETIEEFSGKKISPRLIYLAKVAKYYKNFEEFEKDYILKNFHGIYWHLTVDPNFKINPNQVPTDLSSLSSGTSTPGLMVTTHISNWDDTFERSRLYVAQIDLSDLKPNIDYINAKRGFGHEIFVFKPAGAKVVKVLPIKKALRRNNEDYKSVFPKSSEELKRLWDLVHLNDIKESFIDANAEDMDRYSITKLEEDFAVNYLSKKLLPVLIKQFNAIVTSRYNAPEKKFEPISDVKSTVKSLKKVRDMHDNPGMRSRTVNYKAIAPTGTELNFKIHKRYDNIVTITYYTPYSDHTEDFELRPLGNPRGPFGYDTLSENTNKDDLKISRTDELQALDYIGKHVIWNFLKYHNKASGRPITTIKQIFSKLQKFADSHNEFGHHIEYRAPLPWSDMKVAFDIYKTFHNKKLRVTWTYIDKDGQKLKSISSRYYVIVENSSINTSENIESKGGNNRLRISKQEEEWALNVISKRTNSQGELIGKYLKKKNHYRAESPYYSDRIKFLNTDDGTTITIEKDPDGRLIYHHGFLGSSDGAYSAYESPNSEFLTESADWRGWGMITEPEKERLKIVLEGWIKRIQNIYSDSLSRPKIFLIKKVIDNLVVTDPRFAARPLARLSMEDRLSLGDFIDSVDTTGVASRTFDLLMDLSREYIEPPKPPKPDIILKKIADMVWPAGARKSDVYIYGLDDMKPVIGFEFYFGGFSLTDSFIASFLKSNELYVDLGAEVKIVNMIEVISQVKKALDDSRGQINEDVNKLDKYAISKSEEEEGLNYINKILIPKLKESSEKIRRGLKKVVHQKFSYDPSGAPRDIIGWEYDRGDDYKFTFFLIKFIADARIMIGYITPGGNISFYYMGSNPVERSGILIPQEEKFVQIFRKSNGPINEVVDPKQQTMSKMDEERAVAYINRLSIDGNRVGKNLKKVREIPSGNIQSSHYVRYESSMGGEIYVFDVYRSWRQGLVVMSHANLTKYIVDKP